MTIRAVLLPLFAFVLAAPPARAQGPNGPPLNSVFAQVADLQARVAKLEGKITAADLVGTYALAGIQTTLRGNPDARIGSDALTGTLTLNSNGTGTLTDVHDGARLFTQSGALSQQVFAEELDLTWTYANGVVSTTFIGIGQGPDINVGPGGRLLVAAFSNFEASLPRSGVLLLIFSRLQ
jgi:hypothetical protein